MYQRQKKFRAVQASEIKLQVGSLQFDFACFELCIKHKHFLNRERLFIAKKKADFNKCLFVEARPNFLEEIKFISKEKPAVGREEHSRELNIFGLAQRNSSKKI